MHTDRQRLETRVQDAELRVADTVGALMEFWGFKRAMGRVWTLLYLSPDPVAAAEVAERLQMSAGAVSMTLADLVKWGTIRKAWRPGERRDFFEAETSIWKMITRVLREREMGLIRDTAEALAAAESALAAAGRSGDRDLKRRVGFMRERLSRLRLITQVGETLLGAIVAGELIDTTTLRTLGAAMKDEGRDR